ncbi:hypothetical protein [Halocynthiibacter styelae]|uniref:Tail fiber protein n=1 Tax=Halocynthiibacter styelae TaxID=2761955 RepID=A0A8J7IR69_9RHOB|nr:hypothetical protein [Paenihalocynthiibacter styelae]MBI1495406.1 hypothetical protein [Paenihalocynthiibacter styelae]
MVDVASLSYLPEAAGFPAQIPQLEDGFWPTGGPVDPANDSGIMNWQAQLLASRTRFNKTAIEALQVAFANIDVAAQINAAIADLIDGAPGALDTLNELAAAVQANDGEIAAALSQITNAMVGANNLSEVVNPAQARVNIGAGTPRSIITSGLLAYNPSGTEWLHGLGSVPAAGSFGMQFIWKGGNTSGYSNGDVILTSPTADDDNSGSSFIVNAQKMRFVQRGAGSLTNPNAGLTSLNSNNVDILFWAEVL